MDYEVQRLIQQHKSEVYRRLKAANPEKEVTAFTAGNFDIIHPGYTATFEEAKRHCDKFIIFLHGDPSATRNTKYKPIVPYYDRYKMLMSIRHVDEVYMYQTEDELYNLMKLFDCDVRILGEDYLGVDFTGSDLRAEVIYTTRSHEWSTTKFKNRVAAMTLAQNKNLLDLLTSDDKLLQEIKQGNFSCIENEI